MKNHTCRICGNADNNIEYDVREMLHGTRERFKYFQCSACGCLQVDVVPGNLARYYPTDYQAYKNYLGKANNKIRLFLESRLAHYGLARNRSWSRPARLNILVPDYVQWCRNAGIKQDSKILDVGSGNGRLISRMLCGGFTRLHGIDPFINQDISFNQYASIFKRDLSTHIAMQPGKYDLVMLHHSFEHMDNPDQVLAWCSQLLEDNGVLLIRVPLADSEAWERYREHWYSLDAPRHLYLHTSRSMHILMERGGFIVDREERDSTEDQFTYSELYRRDIAANESKSIRNIFSKSQIRAYISHARQLNDLGRGDQGVFYIRKATAKQ